MASSTALTGIKAVDDEFRKRRHLHIAFLDLSQAYDSVNRTKLFEVLRVFYKVDPQLVQQLEALYTDNTGTHPASLAPPPAASTSPGRPPGLRISPLLFIAYLDHLMRGIETQCRKQGVKLEYNRDLMRKEKMGDAMFGPSRSGDAEVHKYHPVVLTIRR